MRHHLETSASSSDPADEEIKLVVASEFGQIELSLVRSGQATVLQVRDMRTGRINRLDPLELECLAWASHEDLAPLLDPSQTRWPAFPAPEDAAPTDSRRR